MFLYRGTRLREHACSYSTRGTEVLVEKACLFIQHTMYWGTGWESMLGHTAHDVLRYWLRDHACSYSTRCTEVLVESACLFIQHTMYWGTGWDSMLVYTAHEPKLHSTWNWIIPEINSLTKCIDCLVVAIRITRTLLLFSKLIYFPRFLSGHSNLSIFYNTILLSKLTVSCFSQRMWKIFCPIYCYSLQYCSAAYCFIAGLYNVGVCGVHLFVYL